MKLECSLDLKKCSCERNFCRKSYPIHPYNPDINVIIPYHQKQSLSVSKHGDSNGARLIGVIICVITCCIFIPICGLWIGPLMYYLQIIKIIHSPTLEPTLSPTFQPSFEILDILNESFYNISNISNITI